MTSDARGHRRCQVVRGSRGKTRTRAEALTAGLPGDAVLWVSDDPVPRVTVCPRSRARRLLGGAFDAVVLDLHDGLDADVLGQCHGFVWGGGRLVLRMPTRPPPQRELAVFPYRTTDVGVRMWRRLERLVADHPAVEAPTPVAAADHDVEGTADQARVVHALAALFASREPAIASITADRGRGKSSALGLALAAHPDLPAVVTGPTPEAAHEVLRFAPHARWVDAAALVDRAAGAAVVVVDEAAQLPVPVLQQLVERNPKAHLAFATTTHGYEGTGRGYVLRFGSWLARQSRPVVSLELIEPIRWGPGDPLEALIFEILALDAAVAPPVRGGGLDHVRVDRDALEEGLLTEIFGLLRSAHYRTTPSDLHRLLDAPNLDVHAMVRGGHVVAASLVAREGGLPPDLCERMANGSERIRGHALADTLVSHAGHPEAGGLEMVRSVRIASHPDQRRQGLGRALADAVHDSYDPDLFGTMFGATADLVRFRQRQGYRVVRVGVSRGARTGEPSAVLVRPGSAAEGLVDALRVDLARGLDRQLELMHIDGAPPLHPDLVAALHLDLPTPPPLTDDEIDALVRSYASGIRPYAPIAFAVEEWVRARQRSLRALDARIAIVVRARVLQRRSWSQAAKAARLATRAGAMRWLRRGIRAMLDVSRPTP